MKCRSYSFHLMILGLFRSTFVGANNSNWKTTCWGTLSLTSSSLALSRVPRLSSSSCLSSRAKHSCAAYTSSHDSENDSTDEDARHPSLTLRIARLHDVPGISSCNLACLPENYNHGFYSNHIRQWPDLAIVAVVKDELPSAIRSAPHLLFHPRAASSHEGAKFTTSPNNHNTNHNNNNHNLVVAYVLGKVESHTELTNDTRFPYQTVSYGHVTSLAVQEQYRRQGLAAELMKQLHYQLETYSSGCRYCGLHVRRSNEAAIQLYQKFGYSTTEIIPTYYQDGEDAYYMTRPLLSSPPKPNPTEESNDISPPQGPGFLGNGMFKRRNNNNNSQNSAGSSNFFLRNTKKNIVDETPENFRLPRTLDNGRVRVNNRNDTNELPITQELISTSLY